MSKNFKSTLRHWLSKVYNLCKKPKKTACSTAKKMTQIEVKQSRDMVEERIADTLFEKFQELKTRGPNCAQGEQIIQEFLKENDLSINEKLHQKITLHIQKYLFSNEQNTRNFQDYVPNVWNSCSQTYECICPRATKDLQVSQPKQVCYRCNRVCHTNCMWGKDNKEQLYECPMCFMIKCIPNREVKKILFAGFLRQIKKDKIQYKINLPLQIGIIEEFHIEARCVRLCKQSKYEITWPMNSIFSINNKKIMDFKPLNTNSSLKKRTDDEIVLEKRFLGCSNTIIIQQRHQYNEGFRPTIYENHFISISLVKSIPTQSLMTKMMQYKLSIQQSKFILGKYLDRGIQDCIIDKIKVSLKCQLYNGRINIPVRSKHCTSHYQPFDLKGFIMANINLKASSQRWRCPICRERAYHLLVDQHLYSYIQTQPKIGEIIFNTKGDPQIIQKQESDEQNYEVIECQENQSIILQQQQQVSHKPSPLYSQFIQIQSDDDLQINLSENNKRIYQDRSIDNNDINQFSNNQPQKKFKNDNSKQNKQTNPLSFLLRKTSALEIGNENKQIEEEYINSQSDIANNQSKYSPDNQYFLARSNKKGKKEKRGRKPRVFQEEVKKDTDKMAKNLVPSPAISTVIPEAIRIHQKKLPEISKKNMQQSQAIQINSQEDDQQIRKESKLAYHKQQLNQQKHFLIHKTEKCQISASDQSFFLSQCERFMTGSIKGF